MTSQQIQYVLMIAQERSFSKAAKKLYMTQPSLSRFIISLEEQLGYKLFDRSVSPLSLTVEGEFFVAAAAKMNRIEEELAEQIRGIKGIEQAPLRVGITPFRAMYYLPLILHRFHSTYPKAEIKLYEKVMTQLKEDLLSGDLDIIIGPGPIDESNINYDALAEDHVYLAVPPDDCIFGVDDPYVITLEDILSGEAEKKECVDFSVVAGKEFISYMSEAALSRYLDGLCQQNGFDPKVVLRARNFYTALMIIQAGFGCTLTFETVIKLANFDRHPRYYRLDIPGWPVVAAYRKNFQMTFIQKEFLRMLREIL